MEWVSGIVSTGGTAARTAARWAAAARTHRRCTRRRTSSGSAAPEAILRLEGPGSRRLRRPLPPAPGWGPEEEGPVTRRTEVLLCPSSVTGTPRTPTPPTASPSSLTTPKTRRKWAGPQGAPTSPPSHPLDVRRTCTRLQATKKQSQSRNGTTVYAHAWHPVNASDCFPVSQSVSDNNKLEGRKEGGD